MRYRILLTILLILINFQSGYTNHIITKADSLFELRSARFNTTTLLADTTNINHAMMLFKNIIDSTENNDVKHEALWKYLKCVFFKGLFGTHNIELRRNIYSKGIDFVEKNGVNEYDTAPVHCWLGIHWGYCGEMNGKLASARAGVPQKVRFHAERVIELDSTFLDAGGFRMLGRLHYKVPKIPLLLGWPSKEKAELYLRRAYQMFPENLFNKLYLAECLLDRNQEDLAIQLLNEIINEKVNPDKIASDLWIQQKAKKLLDRSP